jgi:hypothetical protein
MTARVEGLILSAVEGERAAREVLEQIAADSALPDALLLRLLDLQAEDRGGAYVPPTPRVRAFLRAIQKRLEARR